MNTTITEKLTAIAAFYSDGFRAMRLGRRLWLLIMVKLLVIFGVMKLFFFPDVLQTNFDSDAARSRHVLNHLIKE